MNAPMPDSYLDSLPMPLDRFTEAIGFSESTIWRFRKQGWLKTTNIAGKQFLMPEAVLEFNRRAASGEFSHVRKTDQSKRKGDYASR